MFGVGMQELLVILVVALLVLGPKRLPEIARSLGRGMAEFRRASTDLRQALTETAEPAPRRDPPAPDAPRGSAPTSTPGGGAASAPSGPDTAE